jgi:hypothetical protein
MFMTSATVLAISSSCVAVVGKEFDAQTEQNVCHRHGGERWYLRKPCSHKDYRRLIHPKIIELLILSLALFTILVQKYSRKGALFWCTKQPSTKTVLS